MEGGLATGAAAVLGFLLGSVPFGFLLTRAAGLGDIRAIGSGSTGATNVLRTGRKGLAAATLLLDAAKGVLAVALASWLFGPAAAAVAAVAAVVGHCHPPWLAGRGGKGVATAAGALLALSWPAFLIAAAVWLGAALASRISSVGALAALAAAPVAAFVFAPAAAGIALLAIAAFVAWRHKANIQRLLAGTEPRIGQGK
ncbi:MAG: glycerol-3-phosphate 1-O-acyltransferase PlsY [Acetobacteraceae bacterium]|nr:glycerol-3-phosphate 1-O-acyltransferase PlsY [Acetobacteraceae bacterium]